MAASFDILRNALSPIDLPIGSSPRVYHNQGFQAGIIAKEIRPGLRPHIQKE